MIRNTCLAASCLLIGMATPDAPSRAAEGPTDIKLEYLMSMELSVGSTQSVSPNLLITEVSSGGWIHGPNINGRILAPAGDWLRIAPSGGFQSLFYLVSSSVIAIGRQVLLFSIMGWRESCASPNDC